MGWDWREGVKIVNIFFGAEISSSGVEIFSGGLRNFFFGGGGGLKNFWWGVEKIFCGGGGVENFQKFEISSRGFETLGGLRNFLKGLRNFRGVENYSGGSRNFKEGGHFFARVGG